MTEDTISRAETVIGAMHNREESGEENKKWNEVVTPSLITSNLERLVLSSNAEKAYNTVTSDGITSSKRTLELLLARNGRAGGVEGAEAEPALINNKSYTLDTTGRVCLVKNGNQKRTRIEEVRNLERETRELRELEKNLEFSLELIMQEHRKMMLKHLKNKKENDKNRQEQIVDRVVNDKNRQKQILDRVVNNINSKLTSDFVTVTKILDATIAKEEERTKRARKVANLIEIETFLMKCLLNMEDIREASVDYLVDEFRKCFNNLPNNRPDSKSENEQQLLCSKNNNININATGDN